MASCTRISPPTVPCSQEEDYKIAQTAFGRRSPSVAIAALAHSCKDHVDCPGRDTFFIVKESYRRLAERELLQVVSLEEYIAAVDTGRKTPNTTERKKRLQEDIVTVSKKILTRVEGDHFASAKPSAFSAPKK